MKFGDKIKDLEMKKTMAYVRTSTSKQGNSIEMQKNQITDYCERNNLVLTEMVVDEGLSGKSTKNRCGYQKIMDMVKNGEVDTLIVLSLSRWGRNLKQNYESIEIMKKMKANFVSLKEQVDLSSPMGRFMVNIMASLYEMEREMISDKVRDVLMDKKQQGKIYGHVPFGYKDVLGRLVENKTEQKSLKKMQSLKSKGYSLQNISDFLNRNKHKRPNGNKWNRHSVYNILKTDRKSIIINQ